MSRTIIIGGSAAGATVAARLRRLDEHQEIVIYEKGPDISYASCGLPYHIGGVLPGKQSLVVTSVGAFVTKYNVEVKPLHEVLEIHPENRTVTVKRLADGKTITDSYDSLVIAAGASPAVPGFIKGANLPQIKTLRTIADADCIRKDVISGKIRSAVIAGGGFIGVELAENLIRSGVRVTLVELKPEVLGVMDSELGRLMTKHLVRSGVDVRTGTGIKSFIVSSADGTETVDAELTDGTHVESDLAVLALGIRPNTDFLKNTGISTDEKGFIRVTPYFETGVDGIYAAGDIAAVSHVVTGKPVSSALAGPAVRGARIIAGRIAGLKDVPGFPGTAGSGIVQAFNLQAGITGFGAEYLEASGLVRDRDFFTAFVSQKSHVGWFPGAGFLFIKGMFEKKSGRILGVEAVGSVSVDKVIDAASALILKHGTYRDLADFDAAYAPQFNAPKSPLNMLGFTAENIDLGLESQTDIQTLLRITGDMERNGGSSGEYYLLDVREPSEVRSMSLPYFSNIPLGTLRDSLAEIPKDKTVIITCAVGVRAWNAARILAGYGYRTSVLTGGASFYAMYR
ncbi:MAG: FAD-dependent oxidoreductase [Ruminobacter sp.]|uniref:FAD-dependent oxidoreductase n=1 Tax=Ruminobacter sp. TaxID=2774296 RepID=UPI001B4E8682|nr:FAD-dependent oxidoreductase [Ruminobacter sp.]MBP3749159.1 FAD-dependent oxidoreductase [Ruminobacter sp.]